jgi:hypothetical protein
MLRLSDIKNAAMGKWKTEAALESEIAKRQRTVVAHISQHAAACARRRSRHKACGTLDLFLRGSDKLRLCVTLTGRRMYPPPHMKHNMHVLFIGTRFSNLYTAVDTPA